MNSPKLVSFPIFCEIDGSLYSLYCVLFWLYNCLTLEIFATKLFCKTLKKNINVWLGWLFQKNKKKTFDWVGVWLNFCNSLCWLVSWCLKVHLFPVYLLFIQVHWFSDSDIIYNPTTFILNVQKDYYFVVWYLNEGWEVIALDTDL